MSNCSTLILEYSNLGQPLKDKLIGNIHIYFCDN